LISFEIFWKFGSRSELSFTKGVFVCESFTTYIKFEQFTDPDLKVFVDNYSFLEPIFSKNYTVMNENYFSKIKKYRSLEIFVLHN
jgi:hypothetical protein